MYRKHILLVAFLVLISLGPMFASGQTVANSTNFHGQEIQKLIDYLRSLNYNAEADNIEKYLNNSQIIIKPLSSGQHGQNKWPGGPVYVDPGAFNNPRLPWNKTKPSDESAIISLASTLLHEKYHSEHHGVWKRVGSNGGHWLGGGNPMEVEGWNVTMDFLDRAINETLKKAQNSQSTAEREHWLDVANQLLGIKLTRITDYNNNKYGPQLWNATELGELKRNVTEKLEKLQRGEETSLRTVIGSHNEFERKVKLKTAEYFVDFNQKVDAAANAYGAKLAQIPLMLNNKSSETPVKVEVNLSIDSPSDLGAEPYVFQINYRGVEKPVAVEQNLAGFHPQYYLTISSSKVTSIYRSAQPLQLAQELLSTGEITISSTAPLGRQFEDTCGNSLLDTGEQCDYGYACPERLICSVICNCIYPRENATGNNLPLPPREPVQPDENGIYYGSLINTFNSYLSSGPSFARSLLGNERVALIVTSNGKEYTYVAVMQNGALEKFRKGEAKEATLATLKIKTSESVAANIINSSNPSNALQTALADGSIKLTSNGVSSTIKTTMINAGVKIASLLKPNEFEPVPGREVPIIYGSEPAKLFVNQHKDLKVRIITIGRGADEVVVNRFGSKIGYTSQQVQTIITKQPAKYSANAGIYAQPPSYYTKPTIVGTVKTSISLPQKGTIFVPYNVVQMGYYAKARSYPTVGRRG